MLLKNTSTKQIISFLFVLILGIVFIISGQTKFISIEPFEWTFMDLGFSNSISFFLARFLIGFEFALALLLILHLFLKKFSLAIVQIFLMVMTLYLVVLLITKGNNVDCGCFGDSVPMTPIQSILKNLVMMAMVYFVQKNYAPINYKFQTAIAIIGTLACLSLPFVFVPFTQKPSPINLNALYAQANNQPKVDLRKGKHLVAFMSLGCPHCRKAANTFAKFYAEDSTLPIMMILNGNLTDTSDFFKETKANKVPHFVFNGAEEFVKMAGPYVPQIYWINNSVKERQVNYSQLSTGLLENWKK